MYNKIVNPNTGRYVSIFTNKGQSIIHNFFLQLQSGGSINSKYENLEDIKNLNKIIGNDKMEGNCMYKHHSNFELRSGEHLDNLRHNLDVLGQMSNKILEIGFNGGHSAAIMLNNNKSAHLVAMDIGKHNYTRKCINYFKNKYNIDYVEGDSNKTLPNYNPGIIFDLIHVDGGHGVKTANNDIIHSKKLSDSDTLLLVDDTNFKRLRVLLDDMIEDGYLTEVNYQKLNLKPTKYHRVFNYVH